MKTLLQCVSVSPEQDNFIKSPTMEKEVDFKRKEKEGANHLSKKMKSYFG